MNPAMILKQIQQKYPKHIDWEVGPYDDMRDRVLVTGTIWEDGYEKRYQAKGYLNRGSDLMVIDVMVTALSEKNALIRLEYNREDLPRLS